MLLCNNAVIINCKKVIVVYMYIHLSCLLIESIPLVGRHGNTQTNEPLNRDGWGVSKLLSRGLRDRLLHNTDKLQSEPPHWLESYSVFNLLWLIIQQKICIHITIYHSEDEI